MTLPRSDSPSQSARPSTTGQGLIGSIEDDTHPCIVLETTRHNHYHSHRLRGQGQQTVPRLFDTTNLHTFERLLKGRPWITQCRTNLVPMQAKLTGFRKDFRFCWVWGHLFICCLPVGWLLVVCCWFLYFSLRACLLLMEGSSQEWCRPMYTSCVIASLTKLTLYQLYFQMTLFPGVNDGSRLRVRGEGNAGIRRGPKGDLYVELSVPCYACWLLPDNPCLSHCTTLAASTSSTSCHPWPGSCIWCWQIASAVLYWSTPLLVFCTVINNCCSLPQFRAPWRLRLPF